MIYLWEKHRSCTNRLIAAYNRDESPDRFLFLDGIKLSPGQISGKPIFDHEVTRAEISKYDSMPNNSNCPLVNEKIVELLLQLAPNEVQFFDAEVRCKDGVLTNYKLVNVISTITGIDHDKSEYSLLGKTGRILSIKYLTYIPGCMGEHHVARDTAYLGNLLVSETVKQAFDKVKVTGIWFARPEEFYRPLRPEDVDERHTQAAMDIVARKMDVIVSVGQAQNWEQAQYSEALHLLQDEMRQELQEGQAK